MKKRIIITQNGKSIEKQISYIPARYIVSVLLILFEIISVISIMVFLSLYVPYFWLAELLTQIGCVISIVARKDNPDYKLPWLLFVMAIPIVGFMCYFLFYERKLSRKQRKRIEKIRDIKIKKENTEEQNALPNELARSQAESLYKLSASNLYQNTDIRYFSLGEDYFLSLIEDLKSAKEFIFMEYFIIEHGLFWNSILEILKGKAQKGVEVKIVYDDIGCMGTLPGNYYKQLAKYNITSISFSRLRGQANNEFNNRNHRKITVIDGKIGYTGGINLADEYINHIEKFGHWKDSGLRLEGEAVNELTRLFLCDYEMSINQSSIVAENYYRDYSVSSKGFCVPFGDGPKPIFERQVSKTAIMNMLAQAEQYVWITSPYLIIDNDLVQAIENAAIRGIDVRIITPHIPDKKLVLMITRSYYERLISCGVKIYEYTPGFIHAKSYLSDDKCAIIGTINLDYRSLVHHFENGVWIYEHDVLKDIKEDFICTQEKSAQIEEKQFVGGLFKKFILAILKVFTPLL